jgi:UDP-GlcNAc:undecaprenyl-phosphate GlcNAc-1-phosphate transferase
MGDSGAMFLGLLISASAITLTGQVDATAITEENSGNVLLPLLLPFAILAIPLLDFLMAIIRRVKAGRSPFDADREHLHHRIMRLGLTQQSTTIILYMWTAMFALPTVIAAFTPLWVALIVGFVIFILSIITIRRSRKSTNYVK